MTFSKSLRLLTVTICTITSGVTLQAAAAGVEQGYITTHDGFRLYYEKAGNGPVLILPGRLFLFPAFQQLADKYTVISYDMRNRGKSDSIADGSKLTIQDDVRDLETVRAHFKVNKFTPVGYSYLGLMVVMYAMDHPKNVERIVQLGPVPLKFGTQYPPSLIAGESDTGAPPADSAKFQQMEKDGSIASRPKEFCEQQWKVFRYVLVGNPANVSKLGPGLCDMKNEWPVNLWEHHFKFAFLSVQKLDLPKSALSRVRVPVLTIHGTKDRNAPYGSGREWAMNLPDSRLLTIKDGAHQSFDEYPEMVFPAIREFLAGQWPQGAEKVSSLLPAPAN